MELEQALKVCEEIVMTHVCPLTCDGNNIWDIEKVKGLQKLLKELKYRRKYYYYDTDDIKEYVFDYNRTIKAGQKYKHFKNKMYIVVIPCVFHTDDLTPYVVYRGADNARRMWARPIEEFMSEVDHRRYPSVEQKHRFELMEE